MSSATDGIHETAQPPPEGDEALYERDFYAWALDQGQRLRDFSEAGLRLPGIDLDHVAEEIADLGNEQLTQVESHLEQAYIHIIKLLAMSNSDAVRGWRSEVRAALSNAEKRYRPSMRPKLDNDLVWRRACRDAIADLADAGYRLRSLPTVCPFDAEALLLSERPDVAELVTQVERALRRDP